MGYPDNLDTAALDRATSSHPYVPRRENSADEKEALRQIEAIATALYALNDLAIKFIPENSDGESYLQSLVGDGVGYAAMLRAFIRVIPVHEAWAEQRRIEDDQNEAGQESDR